MSGFPLGVIALMVVAALIYLGLAHRVLDRLYLSDSAALVVVTAMAVGSFIDIPLARGSLAVSINLGGGIIPIGLAVYVLVRAGTSKEVARALLAILVTAVAVFLVNSVFVRADAFDTRTGFLDPLYVYPLVAGIVAYLAGRSRRSAFIAAVLGVLVLDIADFFRLTASGTPGQVAIGGAGVFDITVLAGVIAVLLAEVIGEVRERMQGGVQTEGRSPNLLRALRNPPMGVASRKPERGDDKE